MTTARQIAVDGDRQAICHYISLHSSPHKTKIVIGKLNFVAASSNSFKGQGVDMWAAGVTLFCFVFGKVCVYVLACSVFK